jgi:DNA modification methylase
MKPIKLLEKLIKNSSARKELVIDPFAGSGSTMIACQNLNRKARLIELSPQYCDVIIKRFINHTGLMAINLKTGKNFEMAR